jgi:phage baseplate assembly protein gpV
MSKLKLFSLGIVVEDKPQEDDYITVTPIEHLSIQEDGDLTNKTNDIKGNISSLTNDGNQSFDTEHKVTNKIKAKWISFGVSNRETAPDVYRGETVILFQYANVDEYYWTTLFREPSLRKQETVLYTYSNQKAPGSSYDPNTSYWTRIDTRNKKVQWHTSNNDGELTTYDSILDTKEGVYIPFQDGIGNYLILNSKEKTITLRVLRNIRLEDNASTDFIEINLDENRITLSSNNSIILTSKTTIELNTKNVIINTKTFEINANSMTVNCPTITFNGNLSVSGNFSTGGGSSGSSATIGGDLTVNGTINANGSVHASNVG